MADPGEPLAHVEKAPGYGKRFAHRTHSFINAGIGAAAFILSAVAVHSILPQPDVGPVSAKVRYFCKHKDEFDTFFIGSSHIYREVVPETFDQISSERGVPTRSFNMGMNGMHPPESLHVLEQALRCKPSHLKWVWIELEELYSKIPQESLTTRRMVYWHDLPLTWLTVSKSVNPDGHRAWRKIFAGALGSETVRNHLGLLIKNFANVGHGRDVLDSCLRRRGDDNDVRQFSARRGYVPKINQARTEERIGEEDLTATDMATYPVRLREETENARHEAVDPITEKMFRKAANELKPFGAKLICVVPPNLSQTQFSFRGKPPPGPTIEFNDANKYPALYQSGMRVDPGHLSDEGAQLFTRLLAERFVTEVALGK